uniref:G-protein coupled receptor family C group 6 member A n=1 Tax=Poecilia latipinna TaxID=48699 RepID=A0A3B3U8C9_9TELE
AHRGLTRVSCAQLHLDQSLPLCPPCWEAKSPGDIMIGGLFPIHESVSKTGQCDSVARLAQSLMMVHAVEEINRSGELGNITLGFHIMDSCADVTTALRNTLSFMKMNREQKLHSPRPPVTAVIGDYYSEISIAVTRHLNLEQIPQISYGATSGLLSDKTRFPSFLRTVPQDDHQAFAIVEILKKNNWTWVGVVATDGEYGRYAVERLRHHAAKNSICFAYINFLPEFLVDVSLNDSIAETVKNITDREKVSVIVSFAKPDHMKSIFNNLLENDKGKHKVWLASDNWSQAADCLDMKTWSLNDVGTVFGITLKSGDTSKFKRFLRNLDEDSDLCQNNPFLSDFLKRSPKASFQSKIEELANMSYPYAAFSIELAVRAIAATVKDLCVDKQCNISTLQPETVRKHIDFIQNNTILDSFFKIDVDSGYDLILWRSSSQNTVDMSYSIGRFDIETKRLYISNVIDQIKNIIKGNKCVYLCFADSAQCYKCDENTEYSDEGSSSCKKRLDLFLKWGDPYHITLLAFTSLGAMLTLTVDVIFLARWNTPVVRSSVGPICIVLLFSLLCTFGSVPLFGARPSDEKCRARQVFFGLSFTLSVSCILVKSFKIILAFEFDPVTQDVLKKVYKPPAIIALCMAGQAVVCTVWLSYKAPQKASEPLDEKRLWFCNENSYPAFGAMLAYIGLLAILGFVLAFKGRKLPQCYNDAKFITFSMLIYFIAWIIFGPVYKNVKGEYHPAVEMVVIVISAYAILFCQFLIKCYIILFKQEKNTEAAFRQEVREFSYGSDRDVEGNRPDGVQNAALSLESLPLESLPLESLPSPESFQPLSDRRRSTNTDTQPFFPVSNAQPALPSSVLSLRKKPLQRFSSLPT